MKKILFTTLVSLGSILGTLLVTNLGSPTIKGIVSWLNPPEPMLSTRGQQLGDSLEAGDGWAAKEGDKLVHLATGLELSIARKDEKDLGNLKIVSIISSAMPPKYSASDLRLLRAYYEKRLGKIEDEYESNRLEGLRKQQKQVTQTDLRLERRVLIPIVPPTTIDESEVIPVPNK